VDYKRVHGNCNVSQGYKPDKALGIWVKTQRKNKEAMSDKRRKKLNSIGFAWKFLETWGVRFQQLVKYKRIQGHCNVPRHCKANMQLGKWVNNQRNTKEIMSENKRNQLNSIEFVWRLTAARPKQQRQVRPPTVEGPKKKKSSCMTIQLKKTRVPDMKLGIPISNSFREFVKTYKHCIQSWDDGQRSSDNCTSGSK